MVELFANSGDPDQTPHSAASDLGLYCLPITLLGVSRLQLIKLPLPQTMSSGPLKFEMTSRLHLHIFCD